MARSSSRGRCWRGAGPGHKNIRFGVLVSCNTFRHPPLVAKEAVTLDHISNGRLEFGLGAGWFVPEHEMFGIPFPANAELVGRFREAVEICHPLFTQDVTTYEGEYYQIRDAPFRPAPVQSAHPLHPRRARPAHDAHRGPLRGPLELDRHDRGNGRAQPDRWMRPASKWAGPRRDPALTPLRAGDSAAGDPWDSPEALRDFVGRFHEIGIREAIFQIPPDIEPAQIERIAETAAELARGSCLMFARRNRQATVRSQAAKRSPFTPVEDRLGVDRVMAVGIEPKRRRKRVSRELVPGTMRTKAISRR